MKDHPTSLIIPSPTDISQSTQLSVGCLREHLLLRKIGTSVDECEADVEDFTIVALSFLLQYEMGGVRLSIAQSKASSIGLRLWHEQNSKYEARASGFLIPIPYLH